MNQFTPCIPVMLPLEQQAEAIEIATSFNPANQIPLFSVPDLSIKVMQLIPEQIAVMRTSYWGPKGVHLGVTFLDNPTQACRNKILQYANMWGQHANIKFTESANGEIRIARTRGSGYWSYLGTDILSIKPGQPTMNLDSFTESTSDHEYGRVVCHEFGHCLSGDTLIDCPRDLKQYPQGIPIKELVGKQPWVYAWKDGQIVVRKATRVWLSKRQVKTVKVTLGTGQGGKRDRAFLPPLELIGTPDHPVLLADGTTWKNLGDLQPKDRLCSMYRDKNGDRSRIRWTGQERMREHVFVTEQVYGSRPDNHDSHHKNENKMDQTPENLEWKLEFDHHSDHATGRKMTEEAKKKISEANKLRPPPSKATRVKMSVSQRNRPPMSNETKAKLSATSKGRKPSEEALAKRAESMNTFYANGGRSGMYGKKQSPETIAKRVAAIQATRERKKQEAAATNHTVISVEPYEVMDVYDMTVPDADSFVANGVVVHNSLGFPHEQQRSGIVANIDPAKAIAYFKKVAGWSAAMTQSQVLTPLPDSAVIGTTNPRGDSIMCYQLPGEIMKDGKDIPGGNEIDIVDHDLARKLYPNL